MQKSIHPTIHATTFVCNSCKKSFVARSTAPETIAVEVCANCHPFYTGEAGVIVDTYSRVDRFQKHKASADATKVVNKRKKLVARKAKSTEVKAGPALTLRDMLKQSGK